MLDIVKEKDFAAHVGTRFRVFAGTTELDLELTRATARPHLHVDGFREPFDVVFRGPRLPVLPQSLYRFRHDRMGDFTLFIVPVGPGRDGLMRYQAVFN